MRPGKSTKRDRTPSPPPPTSPVLSQEPSPDPSNPALQEYGGTHRGRNAKRGRDGRHAVPEISATDPFFPAVPVTAPSEVSQLSRTLRLFTLRTPSPLRHAAGALYDFRPASPERKPRDITELTPAECEVIETGARLARLASLQDGHTTPPRRSPVKKPPDIKQKYMLAARHERCESFTSDSSDSDSGSNGPDTPRDRP